MGWWCLFISGFTGPTTFEVSCQALQRLRCFCHQVLTIVAFCFVFFLRIVCVMFVCVCQSTLISFCLELVIGPDSTHCVLNYTHCEMCLCIPCSGYVLCSPIFILKGKISDFLFLPALYGYFLLLAATTLTKARTGLKRRRSRKEHHMLA